MMPYLIDVDSPHEARIDEGVQLLALGIAGEERPPVGDTVVVRVGISEKAHTVSIAALIIETLGPHHRKVEDAHLEHVALPKTRHSPFAHQRTGVGHEASTGLAATRERILRN